MVKKLSYYFDKLSNKLKIPRKFIAPGLFFICLLLFLLLVAIQKIGFRSKIGQRIAEVYLQRPKPLAKKSIVKEKTLTTCPSGNYRFVATTGSDITGSGTSNDCKTCSIPCATIQHAIDQIGSPSTDTFREIRVSGGGSYNLTSTINVNKKSIILKGGYTTSDWNNPNIFTNKTILEGGGNKRIMIFSLGGGGTSSNFTKIEGFWFKNGSALSGPNTENGGAIYLPNTDPNPQGYITISKNYFQDNIALYGGAIFSDISTVGILNIVNNYFTGNNATYDGYGSAVYLSLRSTNFYHNTLVSNGGKHPLSNIARVIAVDKEGWDNYPIKIYNNIIANNTGIGIAAANCTDFPRVQIAYNNVYNNTKGSYNDKILNYYAANPNPPCNPVSICVNNDPPYEKHQNPVFVDSWGNLSSNSPMIGAGTLQTLDLSPISINVIDDIQNNVRPYGSLPDIGIDELIPPSPSPSPSISPSPSPSISPSPRPSRSPSSSPKPVCGNGTTEPGEECDGTNQECDYLPPSNEQCINCRCITP